jgi:hypothetical protein
MDQKAFAFEPHDVDAALHDDTRHRRMGRLGGPAANESVEQCQWVLFHAVFLGRGTARGKVAPIRGCVT